MKERAAAIFLLALGSLGMMGNIVGSDMMRGLAAMTGASPAPKVFSAVKGLETYSTKFRIEWIDHEGAPQSVLLTPELYARIEGPYNRRNVYGAVLAFGPVLVSDPKTLPMWRSVMRYAACGQAKRAASEASGDGCEGCARAGPECGQAKRAASEASGDGCEGCARAGPEDRPLMRELGIDPDGIGGKLRVVLEPLPGTDIGDLPRVLEAPCE